MNSHPKLTAPFELSASFIEFVAFWLDGEGYGDQRWPDQISEELNFSPDKNLVNYYRLPRIMKSEIGQHVVKSLFAKCDLFNESLGELVREIHDKFRFILVVGVPRSGGTYLTAELFSALGFHPHAVPTAIAHDGFPDVLPQYRTGNRRLQKTTITQYLEYITMISLFFQDSLMPTVVPKKMTKAVYAPDLTNDIFGDKTRYIITIRNPIDACVSSYEKSGGAPTSGAFVARSIIEKWILRDLAGIGAPDMLKTLSYFSVYVRYWESFYTNLALGGLIKGKNYKTIPFGVKFMKSLADDFHMQYRSGRVATEFYQSAPGVLRHPEWKAESEQAIVRVSEVWKAVGLNFPVEDIM